MEEKNTNWQKIKSNTVSRRKIKLDFLQGGRMKKIFVGFMLVLGMIGCTSSKVGKT